MKGTTTCEGTRGPLGSVPPTLARPSKAKSSPWILSKSVVNTMCRGDAREHGGSGLAMPPSDLHRHFHETWS